MEPRLVQLRHSSHSLPLIRSSRSAERSTRLVSSERLRGIRTDTPSAQLHTRAACVAGPCLAHIGLGVAASHSVCHRARLRLLLLCLACLFVLWRAPVPPAVAHLCHQLAHAMCRGWPTSRPHLPRRRRARRSARRPSPRSQRSSSRDFGELGAQLGAHRLEASGAPHEISASSALSSAPIASKPGSSSRDLTRSQRAMSRAAGSRAAAWLRCQR